MAFSDFLNDNHAVRNFGEYWCILYLTNASGVEEIVRLSRHGMPSPATSTVIAGDTIAANLPFDKRILRAPEITHSLWRPGSIGGATFPAFGPMVLNNRDGGLDQYKPSTGYKWHDRRCVVYFFDRRDPAGTGGKIFDGRMSQPKFSLVDVTVNLRGNEARFQVPLSQRRYRGSNYMLELSGVRSVDYGTSAAAVTAAGHRTSMTAETWMWIDAWTATDCLAWGWSGQSPWGLIVSSTRVLKLRVYVGGIATDIASTITVPLQTPCHVVFTISGRDLTFYLWNDDTETLTTDFQANAISNATRDAVAGGVPYRVFGFSVAGHVIWWDESRVWNTVRMPAELADNRYSPLATIPAACTHYAKFDDGSGTTVTDSAAGAVHGTIGGAGTSTWLWAMEGAAELAKTPKPDFWGQQAGLPGVLVDPIGANGPSGPTYQIAGVGSMQSITPREGANSITVSSNAASYRAFIVSAPAAGQAITYLARGLVKFGSQPTLPVSFDCEGYNGGALGYVSTAPTITRDIITRRGPKLVDPTDLDTTAFTDYVNAVAGAVMGLYVADPTSERALGEALDACARSGGLGYWGYDRGNTLFTVGRFGGPSTVSNYDYTKRHIVRGSLKEHDIESVIWKVVVRFQPRIVALSEDQVAAAVKGTAGWQVHTQPWQEADAGDESLRTGYPNDSSLPLIVETGIYTRAAAQSLAQTIFDVVGGLKQGWDVTVPAIGQAIVAGDTVTLEFTSQFNVQRLNLDGVERLAVLTSKDMPQRGEVALQLWGDT